MRSLAITAACIVAVLVAAGVGVIWFVRSEWAERRAERAHQADLERRLTAIPPGLAQAAWEQHVADALRATERAAMWDGSAS